MISKFVATVHGQIEVYDSGEGPTVLMLASLGRGAEDFADLAARVAAAGYRAIGVQPRGIGGSRGTLEGVTFDELARDVGAVLEWAGEGPAILIGHAFGNRLARNAARLFPGKVKALILLAAGGQVPIPPDIAADLMACFDEALAPELHLAAVKRGFFAPGNDPAVWQDGWYPTTAMRQTTAVRASDHGAWKLGGGQPMLIVQALQDVIAPPANALALAEAAPDRIRIAEIDGAGHAMLPERPAEIAAHVLAYLSEQYGR
jgi:pimeloyl-ACP methyl ester carboxylesterase